MYGKNIRITRILKDPNIDRYFILGEDPETEFTFDFIIRDEILKIVILACSEDIVITYATPSFSPSNYYGPETFRVVLDDYLFDGFYTALEKIWKGEIQEAFVQSTRLVPRSMPIESVKITITKKGKVLIHHDPSGKRKKDQVEIDLSNLNRFLAILRKVKSLPFVENVRFEELVEFEFGIDD